MQIFKIDQSNPDPEIILEITDLLRTGGVIAFPTDTFYGLGVDIFNYTAIEKVFKIKERMYEKPILILISDKTGLTQYVSKKDIPPYAQLLVDKLWPGPLTLIFNASESIPRILTGTTGKIGIRLPDHTFCRRLVRNLGRPITATSANISNMPSMNNPEEVLKTLKDRIDGLVDGGVTKGGLESTVVDVTGNEPAVLREGAISLARIKEVLGGEGI